MRDYLATFTRSKIAARLIYFLSECFTSNVSILVKLSSYCIPLQIIISLIMILINLFEIETVMLTFILLINKYFELNKNQPSVLEYSINTQHQRINNLFLAMSTLSIFVSRLRKNFHTYSPETRLQGFLLILVSRHATLLLETNIHIEQSRIDFNLHYLRRHEFPTNSAIPFGINRSLSPGEKMSTIMADIGPSSFVIRGYYNVFDERIRRHQRGERLLSNVFFPFFSKNRSVINVLSAVFIYTLEK